MNCYATFFVSEFSILIVGGYNGTNSLKTSEVVAQNRSTCNPHVPDLPYGIDYQPSLIMTHDEKILLCGGKFRKSCLEMKSNTWERHSSLNEERRMASAVVMETGIFLFGGGYSETTWEWLPNNGSSQWIRGDSDIPSPGFAGGCGVKISDIDIALIGGYYNRNGIKNLLIFNTETRNWTAKHDNVLKVGRYAHACISTSNKIIVTGGKTSPSEYLASTEVINLQDLTNSTLIGSLNQARSRHGLVLSHVGNKETLMAFGGYDGGGDFLDTIETWDGTTGNWTNSDIKLSQPRIDFGYLSVPTHILCP